MEDHLIEKNNGLNGMSAYDGGSLDLVETEDQGLSEDDFFDSLMDFGEGVDIDSQMIYPPTVIGAPGTEGSVGTNAFITPLVQYEPHNFTLRPNDDLGLPRPRRKHNFTLGSNAPRRIRIQMTEGRTILNPCDADDDYLLNTMISPPAFIAEAGTDCYLNLGTARHTEQRITPSSLLLNTPLRIGIPEGNSNDWSQKMDFEWIFVITNIVLESMSAIFTQLSSKQKPQYALFGMLLSYLALLTCIIELIYESRHQQIPISRRRWGTWYYYQLQIGRSFATLNNIVALACTLGQCVVTTINYRFESLIKLTVSPIILVFGVLFSKILKYRQREAL